MHTHALCRDLILSFKVEICSFNDETSFVRSSFFANASCIHVIFCCNPCIYMQLHLCSYICFCCYCDIIMMLFVQYIIFVITIIMLFAFIIFIVYYLLLGLLFSYYYLFIIILLFLVLLLAIRTQYYCLVSLLTREGYTNNTI